MVVAKKLTGSNNMKLFLLLCYIFASCTLAYAESDNKKIVKNGLDVLPLKTSQGIPFSEELFGRRVYFPQTTKCLQNRVHGKANGSFLIFCNTEIICIADKKNGLFDGELSIYPDGIFSVRATVKESVLNGWCRMAFQPFKYSFNSKLSSVSNYDQEKIPVPEENWIDTGDSNFVVKTEGYFKDGKKYRGTFLRIDPVMDLRIVRIQTYSNFQLVSVSQPVVFKIKPWENF